jgi:hypothetical protein
MAYDARLATRISPEVDLRLRMLALFKGRPLSHVLDGLLDKALPSAAELAVSLAGSETEEAA